MWSCGPISVCQCTLASFQLDRTASLMQRCLRGGDSRRQLGKGSRDVDAVHCSSCGAAWLRADRSGDLTRARVCLGACALPSPSPSLAQDRSWASAGRPSPSASVRLGIPGPLTHSSVSVESRSQLRLRVRVTWLRVKVTCDSHAPAKSCSSWGGGQSAATFSGVFREIPATLRDVSGASVPGLAPL